MDLAMEAANALLSPGSILDGKWRIDHPLGEGGMGVVYAAEHTRNRLNVAIKVLYPKLAKDPAVRDRFLYEGYAANRVGHAGTVQVLDDGQTPEGLVYLVMERLVGETIAARAERLGGALPMVEVVALGDAMLSTLAAAHRQGIVHRDIKPENVFLTREGALKILDFGLARVREKTSEARRTVAGVLMGTPAFMPPEQAQANWDEVDARSDVYSVGASLWTLATGRLVHDGGTTLQILVKVSTEPAAPLQSVVASAPSAVAAVVDRALKKPREARWADAGTMLEALRVAAVNDGVVAPSLVELARSMPPPNELLPAAGVRRTEQGAPLELSTSDEPSPAANRQRAVVVDAGQPQARPPNAEAQAFAPTALPTWSQGGGDKTTTPMQRRPAFDRRDGSSALPASSNAAVPAGAIRTVSPISSDAPTPRRRTKTSSAQAIVVSAVVLGLVALAFVVTLVVWSRQRAANARRVASSSTESPVELVETSPPSPSATVARKHAQPSEATPTASASAKATAKKPAH